MNDLQSSLPIRTENNGDAVVKLVDGTTNTQYLSIDASGRITTKLTDGTGNAITSQTQSTLRPLDVGVAFGGVTIDPRSIRALTATDVVTANQGATGASAWLTKDNADGPVTPGAVAANSMLIGGQYNSTLPTLTAAQQSAVQLDSSGRLLVSQPTAAALNATVTQGPKGSLAQAWYTQGTDGTNSQAYLATGEAKVSVTQPLPTGTNTIGAVNQGTSPWVTSDLADGSSTGGTAGTKSLLAGGIYNSSLPTLTSGQQAGLQVDSSGRLLVGSIFSPLPAGTNLLGGTNVYVGGTIASATNPVPVTITSTTLGTNINDYNPAASIAANATSNHDYPVTATKTFSGRKFWAAASGKLKIEVQISTNGTVFVSKWVGFNSTATPNITIDLDNLQITDTGTGAIVRIIRTNLDKAAMDVYSTISGTEV